MMQGSEIAPRRRPSTPLSAGSGRRVNEFLIKKFSELCELCASVVNTSSKETRINPNFRLAKAQRLAIWSDEKPKIFDRKRS